MYVKFEYTNGVIGNGKSNNIQYNEKWHKDKKILSNHCAQNWSLSRTNPQQIVAEIRGSVQVSSSCRSNCIRRY